MDLDPTDGSDVDVIWHYGGINGYQAKLYRVNGGGHDWFGAFGNMDVNSAVEMYDFWRQFCEGTADIAETADPTLSLFALQDNALVVAEASFELSVLTWLDVTVADFQSLKGHESTLSEFGGIHLVVGRTPQGIQTTKASIGG